LKFILFCNLPYSFSILKPLEKEITKRGFEYIWYIPESIREIFPYSTDNFTTKIDVIKNFKSNVIFVPGNEVPHFLQGIKVQVFHGLAGEKKGHFRIRNYFDLYLTQGPYFTKKFQELSQKYRNFEVKETGWCKLDKLYSVSKNVLALKENLLHQYGVENIILYSPTFSPSLTSASKLIDEIKKLSEEQGVLVIVKFHDKMDKNVVQEYKALKSKNLLISQEKDILPLLQIADLMISDTSSVVYEFILLDKPVITLDSISENINWEDVADSKEVYSLSLEISNGKDAFLEKRAETIANYHPYSDGKSASRMIEATINYKEQYGVPLKRKLSLWRKFKSYKKYGIKFLFS